MSETLSVAIDNKAVDMAEIEAVVIESAAPEFDEVEFAENASGAAEKDSGEEPRAEVTSAIGQMACVTCVGCPFFDQCVKPQAMAMKQESEEQELSTDTEAGEEAAIIKPAELIPQQSYLEELLAPDEPLDSSGRGQVVRAGYQQPTANITVDDQQEVAMESPEPAAQENDFVEEVAEKTAVMSAPPRDESPREEPESRIEVAAPEAPAVKFDEPEVEENKIISGNDGLAEELVVTSAPSRGDPPAEAVELTHDESPVEIDAPPREELNTDRVELVRDEPSIEIVELVPDESPIEIAPPSRSESPEPEIEKTDDTPTVVEKATIDTPEKLSTEEPQVETITPAEGSDLMEPVTMVTEDIVEPELEMAVEFQPIDCYQNQEAEIQIEEPEIVIDTMIDDVATSANDDTLPLVVDETVKVKEPEIKIEADEVNELPQLNEKTEVPTVECKVIESSIEIEKTAEGLDEEVIELSEDFTIAVEQNDEDAEAVEKKQTVKKPEIIDETPADLDDATIDIQPETEAANKGYGKTFLAQLVGAAVVFLAARQKLDTMKA